MSLTYKGEIVIEYLEKYPNATTMAIARMLHRDYKVDFPTVESVRSLVRKHRNELKNQAAKVIASERTPSQRREAMRNFKSDYKAIKDFILPKSCNRGIIFGDLHVPYHDMKALTTVIEYAIEYKPNFIYINGDFIDMYQLSSFVADRRLRDFGGELEKARELLLFIKETFDCPIYYKIGNHEFRLERYLRVNAPELLGIDDFELQNLLRFGEMGIIKVDTMQKCMMGKLAVFHGHEFGRGVFSPVNPARGLYMKAKRSAIVGHHHQTSEHVEKDILNEVTACWSVGCLCGMSPEYMPVNKWNHGFATIEIYNNGTYHFENKKIIDGQIY